MAKIVKYSAKIAWTPSVSADVANYKVYFADTFADVEYDSSNFVLLPPTVTELVIPKDLPNGFALPELTDDVLEVGVTAVDKAGNESDFLSASVTLDVTPPAPVTNLTISLV